jgi:hypothetical protein
MKINILNYSAWWKVESSLNKTIAGDHDLPDFDAEQKSAEEGIISVLTLRGTKDKDWEVPLHYHRCAAIWAYIHNASLLNERLFDDLCRIIPKSNYPWYVQLECYVDGSESLGGVILHGGECYLNAEDPIVGHLADFLGISPIYAWWRKIWSKFVCLPDHIRLASTVRRALKEA